MGQGGKNPLKVLKQIPPHPLMPLCKIKKKKKSSLSYLCSSLHSKAQHLMCSSRMYSVLNSAGICGGLFGGRADQGTQPESITCTQWHTARTPECWVGELPQARGAWKQKHRPGHNVALDCSGMAPLDLHIVAALIA